MANRRAMHLAFCIVTLVFALAYEFPSFCSTPLFWYRPQDQQWLFAVAPSGVAIDFYGRCLVAAVASGLLGGASYAILRRRAPRVPSGRILALFTIWALGITALAITFSGWRLVHRTLVPPPVPSWYQAR